ncbi:MAG: hypothetical protein RBT63_06740 [Bdellovibrionales bacterium]|jgi:hypothetical protein|nr:hypothetical protein [Bdellovibrionales bacterium]
MSSVGSADKRSSQDEALRRAREEYQEKETTMAKKHAQNLKRMSEAHRAEVSEMQESHNAQLEELKARTREAISARDMKYQKEADRLRTMHQSQLRKNAEENDVRMRTVEAQADGEIRSANARNEQQKTELASQYERQIANQNKKMSESFEQSREDVQQSIGEQKRRMGETHRREMDAVLKGRERMQAEHTRDYSALKQSSDQQIRDLKNAKQSSEQKMSAQYLAGLKEQESAHNANTDFMRESMEQGLADNRERYRKALDKQAEASKNNSEAFQATIGDRVNSRVNRGELENVRLKNELSRQRTDLTRKKNLEVKNTKTAMQSNIDQLEKSRRETVTASNEKTASEIRNLQKKNDELMSRTNRFYQDKLLVDRVNSGERNNAVRSDLEKQLRVSELNAQTRSNLQQANHQRTEASMREFYDQSSIALREQYEQSLRDAREKNQQEQDMIFENFTKQAADRELKFRAKLTDVTSKYENQIQMLKDQQGKQLRSQQTLADRERKQAIDQKNLEIQRQSSQYESRLAKQEASHRQQVDQMNRRHEESLASMTNSGMPRKGRT